MLLRSLVPYAAYFPDFLTPPVEGVTAGLGEGIDRVLATPRGRLRSELSLLAAAGGNPFSGAALARGDVEALTQLGGGLRVYFEAFLEPVWGRVGVVVGADVAWRSRVLVMGGTRALLGSFGLMARWQAPVLEVDYPVERDLYLQGRGLLLVPSYFCWRRPVGLVDVSLRPVLVYPADKSLAGSSASGFALAQLLGSTRAALLHEAAVRECGTTSELAGAVGVSLPSGSQQLAVLREAGLVSSRRAGRHVLHVVTPLGMRLLEG